LGTPGKGVNLWGTSPLYVNTVNRPVRTCMPAGVAGARPLMAEPYADNSPEYNATTCKFVG